MLVAHDNFTRGAVRYAPRDVRVEQRDEPKISSRPTPSSGSMVRCGGGGEHERAFAGDQLLNLLPLFDRHGVQLRSRSSWAEPATNLHSGMVNRDPHELARHLMDSNHTRAPDSGRLDGVVANWGDRQRTLIRGFGVRGSRSVAAHN